jgi:ribosomal protein S18 acetylase RimI-like enzyme
MAIDEVQAKGLESLALATELLQRARLADPEAGVWEAADLQWWWRKPRRSDAVDQLFWLDDEGPAAGVVLTDWGSAWGCDLIVVPGLAIVPLPVLWRRALEAIQALGIESVDVRVDDDDAQLVDLVSGAGFVAGEEDGTGWMNAEERADVTPLPEGFVLVDRGAQPTTPHPMRHRNGEQVESRLRQCSLYDPSLDLAVETADRDVAGYALFWFDPVTRVGMVEPMRVEDEYQRRGLARAMLTAGLARLASRGAGRLKVSYETAAARSLYLGVGFRPTSTSTLYSWKRREEPRPPREYEWLHRHVDVRPSRIEGKGLFASALIRKDERLTRTSGDYVIMSDAELDDYVKTLDGWDSVCIGGGRNKVWLGDRQAGLAHFANHSCDANAEAVEDGLVARCDIAPNDEITVDYALISRSGWSMRCDCGSPNCRGIVHGVL